MPDLNFRGRGGRAAALRGRAAAALQAARHRGRRRGRRADADPRRRPALPGPHRAGPAALLRPRRRNGCSTCSARRSAGARRSGRCSGRTSAPSCRRSRASTVVDLPVPCSSDFNLAATKYFAALEEGEIPLCFLFSGTIFYEARRGRACRSPDLLGEGGRLPPAGGDLARADGPLLSQQRLALPAQGRVRSARPVQEPPGPADLGTGAGAAARRGRGAGDAMNRALVDPIANAVLYEGYILYPYRPSVKNRQRWTFGGLYPEAYCRPQGGGDASTNQTECLVRGTLGDDLRGGRPLPAPDGPPGRRARPAPRRLAGRRRSRRSAPSSRCGSATSHSTTWQEAEERESRPRRGDAGRARSPARGRRTFAFPGGRRSEPLRGPAGDGRRRPGPRAAGRRRESSRCRRSRSRRGCSA